MKKTLNTTKIIALAIAITFATAFTNNTFATETKEPPLLSFNYVGKMYSSPLFKLSVSNANESWFLVEVYDQNGVVLYNDTVLGNSISKKFLLNKYDLKDAVLTFKVTGAKTREYSEYEIDCNTLDDNHWTAKKVH